MSNYKYFFSIGAIFKNESHAIVEWIEHFLYQGAEHFYLIDNGSNDDYYSKIEKFIKNGIVTLFNEKRSYAQVESYNDHLLNISKKETKWIGIFDLDEFPYAQHHYNISDVLKLKKYKNISQIKCPWLVFGSNGHIKQPSSIIDGFTKRADYSKPHLLVTKTIVRTADLITFNVHMHSVKGITIYGTTGITLQGNTITESIVDSFDIIINHYQIQSFDFFKSVKMVRGDVLSKKLRIKRTTEYFKKYDHNDLTDLTLYQIKRGYDVNINEIFDLQYYIENVSDIDKNITLKEAQQHYQKHKNDDILCRDIEFDWRYYISCYKDTADITSYEKAYTHWMNVGRAEKRNKNREHLITEPEKNILISPTIDEQLNKKNDTVKIKNRNRRILLL